MSCANPVPTARRFYLRQRLFGIGNDHILRGTWRAKQEAEPGTPLPAGFPFLSRLATIGYTTAEDLAGADACELQLVGFAPLEARGIITAAASPLT